MMVGRVNGIGIKGTAQLATRERIVRTMQKSLDEVMHMTYLTNALKVETTHRLRLDCQRREIQGIDI